MNKWNIAIIFGGCSSEYEVSLESASCVIRNLNTDKYDPILIGISREGDWFYYTGDITKIQTNTWLNDKDCIPAVLSPSRSKHELILLNSSKSEKKHASLNTTDSIHIDAALPILHGLNGEDGTVQGLIALSGIPLAGCGILASALCMDKDRAHKLVSLTGIRTAKALVLSSPSESELAIAKSFSGQVGFPLFVKPVKAGSSHGISKVECIENLKDAIILAFQYDNEVILEENIDGFEVGCAVLGNEALITGEVDEIELSQGFFDFTEKYTLKSSAIHVPARISTDKSDEIKKAAKQIYKALGCSGFARVDMFLMPSGEIVFNEVNTIPGFTEHSRYPSMMKAAGLSFQDVLEKIIETALIQNRSPIE